MMKKLIRIIIYIGVVLLSFLGIYNFTQTTSDDPIVRFKESRSLFGEINLSYGTHPSFHTIAKIIIVLFALSLAANIILLLVEIIKKKDILKLVPALIANLVPAVLLIVINLILTSAHSVPTNYGYYIFYSYSAKPLFYVLLALLLINGVLLFIKFPEPQEKPTQKSTKETADDLTILQDLLDKGVITQEEFDAKKKQLLGL